MSAQSSSRRRVSRPSNARVVLLVSLVATLIVYGIPQLRFIAYPLLLLSTLVHEMGHGLAALLTGGSFHTLVMGYDGSGVAMWSGEPSRLRLGFVAAGGLVGPAVAAAVAFFIARTPRGARTLLLASSLTLAISMLFVVRGVFAITFVSILLAGLVMAARFGSDDFAQLVVVFLAVQLALSVFSRGDYLFTREAVTSEGVMLSDSSQMAQALFLPFWFWGAACGGFSVLVLLFGIRAYWR